MQENFICVDCGKPLSKPVLAELVYVPLAPCGKDEGSERYTITSNKMAICADCRRKRVENPRRKPSVLEKQDNPSLQEAITELEEYSDVLCYDDSKKAWQVIIGALLPKCSDDVHTIRPIGGGMFECTHCDDEFERM